MGGRGVYVLTTSSIKQIRKMKNMSKATTNKTATETPLQLSDLADADLELIPKKTIWLAFLAMSEIAISGYSQADRKEAALGYLGKLLEQAE